MGKCYYVIRDFEDDVWDVLCTSFEEALGHVVTKINELNKEFRKNTPWKPHDIEYTPGLMEDDFSIFYKRGAAVKLAQEHGARSERGSAPSDGHSELGLHVLNACRQSGFVP